MDYATIKCKADEAWHQLETLPMSMVAIGMGTCGRASGAEEILKKTEQILDTSGMSATIMEVGCIGMCYLEPLMTVRKPGRPPIMYGNLTPEKTETILKRYLEKGDPCEKWAVCTAGEERYNGIPPLREHPMMRHQVRIALRNCGRIDPNNIDHYIAAEGYSGLNRALSMKPREVIDEIKASGLRGRGGAGFPTGLKWEFASQASGPEKYIVCNADEGDPGAFMDRALLEGDPHAVLEGMIIAGYAIGAHQGYIYIRAEYPLAIQRLEKAMADLESLGLIGNRILGSPFSFTVHIKEGAGAFVCGEETALMASIMGGRGMPQARPPFPAQSGLWDCPTNINNVETFGNVSAILQNGATWFSRFGTEKSRGTKTFSLAGKIQRTGLIEVPMGTTLAEIINEIGGGGPKGKRIKGVQTGGPSGGCIPSSKFHLPVDYESLTKAGSIMGSGGMVVMDEDTCMVDIARYFLTFTQAESCGKCMPCRLGTKQMLTILEDICVGKGSPEDLRLLVELGEAIQKGSLCGLGQTAPNPVQSTLTYFRDEYENHVNNHKCGSGVCKQLFHYEIDPDVCNGCQSCTRNCSTGAISGEKKKPQFIDQSKCTRCGICYESCKYQAITIL